MRQQARAHHTDGGARPRGTRPAARPLTESKLTVRSSVLKWRTGSLPDWLLGHSEDFREHAKKLVFIGISRLDGPEGVR